MKNKLQLTSTLPRNRTFFLPYSVTNAWLLGELQYFSKMSEHSFNLNFLTKNKTTYPRNSISFLKCIIKHLYVKCENDKLHSNHH